MVKDLRLYLRLLTYLKPHRLRLALAIVAMLAVSGLTALLAYLVKPVLDDVFLAKRLNMLYLLPPLVVEAGLGLAPGNAFMVNPAPEAQGWLRWCFASRDVARLGQGVERLARWLPGA